MSAHIVYDNAPLGSLIRYSDGTPKPPARFTRKLADWGRRNGLGRLVRKAPPRDRPTTAHRPRSRSTKGTSPPAASSS
ncbi:hypothetical protein HNQ71_004660 [Mesorhizobium sangaii]|uniref:Uncharacterized protein n=1 Tax=Mesorhizobium sangaii TaxID=505389 RepID=A0A841PPA1_9HYPH|nr:hypothetical protein [Mesorhizobium sangaii]